MTIYDLIKLNKEGTAFNARETFTTAEYADRYYRMYLKCSLVENEKGHFKKRFRLHTVKPTSIETALTYDIYCPDCGKRLRQIGRCLDSHDLGLYKCPTCDKW